MKSWFKEDRSLWLAVLLGFGLLAIAWTILFTVASRHPVETVPMPTQEKREP